MKEDKVSISLTWTEKFRDEVDKVANEEFRSRAELVRVALRKYIDGRNGYPKQD